MKLNQEQEQSVLEDWKETVGFKVTSQLETWVMDELHYADYDKFNKLFTKTNNSHKDWGNGWLYYKNEMQYPIDIDPTMDFQKFIRKSCENFPIEITDFKKAWGVDYEAGAYSGMHSHIPGQQLTAVLFLTTAETSDKYPLAGNLVTLQPEDHKISYLAHKAIAGNVVIMDGRVYHGTYPTINNRRVFVCDFDYVKV